MYTACRFVFNGCVFVDVGHHVVAGSSLAAFFFAAFTCDEEETPSERLTIFAAPPLPRSLP